VIAGFFLVVKYLITSPFYTSWITRNENIKAAADYSDFIGFSAVLP